MGNKIISPKHHLLHAISDVNALCEPLFRETEITFFNYARAYDDGSITGLFTHPEWLLYTLNQKIAPSGIEFRGFKRYVLFASDLMAPSGLEQKKVTNALQVFNNSFGFDCLLCINYQQQDFYEAFGFATNRYNKKIIKYYFNNLDYLEKFVLYFRDKASELIAEADKKENRILRINAYSTISGIKNNKSTGKSLLLKDKKMVHLSPREVECLSLITQGRTAKEIGHFLKISDRIAEVHIQNIKTKMGCHFKSELIDIALANQLNFPLKKYSLDD